MNITLRLELLASPLAVALILIVFRLLNHVVAAYLTVVGIALCTWRYGRMAQVAST